MFLASPDPSSGTRQRQQSRIIQHLGLEREFTVVDMKTGRTVSADFLRKLSEEELQELFDEAGIKHLRLELSGEASDSAIEAVSNKLELDQIDDAYDDFNRLQTIIARKYGLALLDVGLPFTAPEAGFDYNHDTRYKEFMRQYGEGVMISLTENSTHLHLGTFATAEEAFRAAKIIRQLQAPLLNLSAATPLRGHYAKNGAMNLRISDKVSKRPDIFKQVASVGERPDDETLESAIDRIKAFVRKNGRPDLADNYEAVPDADNLRQLLKQDHQWVRISKQGDEWTVELRMLDPAPSPAIGKATVKLAVAASEGILQRDLPYYDELFVPGVEHREEAWERATLEGANGRLHHWLAPYALEDRKYVLGSIIQLANEYLPALGRYSDTIATLSNLVDKTVAETMIDEWQGLDDGLSREQKGLYMTAFFQSLADLDWNGDPDGLDDIRTHALELLDLHEWDSTLTRQMEVEIA